MAPGSGGRPAVFLDRDGVLVEPIVIGHRPYPPASADDLVITPATERACRQLAAASPLLVVVTNQPDVARGRQSRAVVDAINQLVEDRLPIDATFVCPHDDADDCACRKPRPGMLLQAVGTLGIDLRRSVMVGDRWRDVEAGRRAGCATVFIDRGYDEKPVEAADLVVGAFADAVPWILQRVCAPAEGG